MGFKYLTYIPFFLHVTEFVKQEKMCISVFICISHFLRLKKFLIGYFCDLKLIMEKLPDMYVPVRYYASCFDIQDCPHVSRTLEEFYTVRCQVTDMKNLYVSFLDPHLHVYSY